MRYLVLSLGYPNKKKINAVGVGAVRYCNSFFDEFEVAD